MGCCSRGGGWDYGGGGDGGGCASDSGGGNGSSSGRGSGVNGFGGGSGAAGGGEAGGGAAWSVAQRATSRATECSPLLNALAIEILEEVLESRAHDALGAFKRSKPAGVRQATTNLGETR